MPVLSCALVFIYKNIIENSKSLYRINTIPIISIIASALFLLFQLLTPFLGVFSFLIQSFRSLFCDFITKTTFHLPKKVIHNSV